MPHGAVVDHKENLRGLRGGSLAVLGRDPGIDPGFAEDQGSGVVLLVHAHNVGVQAPLGSASGDSRDSVLSCTSVLLMAVSFLA